MLTLVEGAAAAALLIASIALWMLKPRSRALEGALAPDFSLQDQEGMTHTLRDYAGQWLVLYFYPRDATPFCTREACAFRDAYGTLRALGASVVGVSVDDEAAHARFAHRHALPFPLLADPRGKVAGLYGSLLNLGFLRVARRHSFVIAPDGRIAARFDRVDPDRHATEVRDTLARLQYSQAGPMLAHEGV